MRIVKCNLYLKRLDLAQRGLLQLSNTSHIIALRGVIEHAQRVTNAYPDEKKARETLVKGIPRYKPNA